MKKLFLYLLFMVLSLYFCVTVSARPDFDNDSETRLKNNSSTWSVYASLVKERTEENRAEETKEPKRYRYETIEDDDNDDVSCDDEDDSDSDDDDSDDDNDDDDHSDKKKKETSRKQDSE